MHIRSEQHSSLTFEKQENIVRQETFHGKMQRTAIQELVLQPLRAYHQVMQVRGKGSEHSVFVLDQFSLLEDKQLEVTLYERNGGRTLTFYVEQEDLLLAQKIDNLKLKW